MQHSPTTELNPRIIDSLASSHDESQSGAPIVTPSPKKLSMTRPHILRKGTIDFSSLTVVGGAGQDFANEAATPEVNLKELINEVNIPLKDKEEIIGFSNYSKLSKDYVEKARA